MKTIEILYNKIFNAVSGKNEWEKWHERTKKAIQEIKEKNILPKELSDQTEIKYYSMLADYIVKKIGEKTESILEVGGGSGALSFYLKKITIAQCTITDNSEVALEYSRLVFGKKDARFIITNSQKLPFESESFDLVHSVGLIEHYSNAEISEMTSEMSRVLKKGGALFLAVPNFFSPDLLFLWHKYGKGSERYITTKNLQKFTTDNGLTIIDCGHSEFCFSKKTNKIIPLGLEKILGRNGLGFLNYVLCKKND